MEDRNRVISVVVVGKTRTKPNLTEVRDHEQTANEEVTYRLCDVRCRSHRRQVQCEESTDTVPEFVWRSHLLPAPA